MSTNPWGTREERRCDDDDLSEPVGAEATGQAEDRPHTSEHRRYHRGVRIGVPPGCRLGSDRGRGGHVGAARTSRRRPRCRSCRVGVGGFRTLG